jgi:hypothetical protein
MSVPSSELELGPPIPSPASEWLVLPPRTQRGEGVGDPIRSTGKWKESMVLCIRCALRYTLSFVNINGTISLHCTQYVHTIRVSVICVFVALGLYKNCGVNT